MTPRTDSTTGTIDGKQVVAGLVVAGLVVVRVVQVVVAVSGDYT